MVRAMRPKMRERGALGDGEKPRGKGEGGFVTLYAFEGAHERILRQILSVMGVPNESANKVKDTRFESLHKHLERVPAARLAFHRKLLGTQFFEIDGTHQDLGVSATTASNSSMGHFAR